MSKYTKVGSKLETFEKINMNILKQKVEFVDFFLLDFGCYGMNFVSHSHGPPQINKQVH